MRIITLSACYGAGGSVIGPLLAERMGLAFLDRAVPAEAGEAINDVMREGASSKEDLTKSLWERILDGFAAVTPEYSGVGDVPPLRAYDSEQQLRDQAERRLRDFAAGGDGIVLGWAGAMVLPEAFRVRLDGPVERRVRRGMEIEGIDAEAARRRLERNDEIRRVYWKRLYRRDWRDPELYHLWLDSTVLDPESVVEVVATAAIRFWDRGLG